jgi:ABC-2 type transport system ATP-binding protein
MDQKLKNYSSGMQVRLAFSVATRAKADILIVDEVLAVGDADFQKKCFNFFKGLKRTGTTVVFVTHDMSAVREYCDRAVLIEKGVVTHEGTAAEVADEYTKLFLPKQETEQEQDDKTRFGTGEVVFENISHVYNSENLAIEFDIRNTTHDIKEGVTIGFDFYVEDEIVTGNGTKYLESFPSEVTLVSGETKHFKATFPNFFGNYEYAVNMNLRNQGNLNVCDELKPAFKFQSNNGRYARFYKIILPVVINEKTKNNYY